MHLQSRKHIVIPRICIINTPEFMLLPGWHNSALKLYRILRLSGRPDMITILDTVTWNQWYFAFILPRAPLVYAHHVISWIQSYSAVFFSVAYNWDQPSGVHRAENIGYDNWATSLHYTDVIMGAIASQITSLTIVYSTVYSDADQRKHQSSASLAFVWGIHRDRWIPRING